MVSLLAARNVMNDAQHDGHGLQSREEGVALAVQLAESKERIRQAENSADDAHDESRALREQLEEAESQMQHMQQRLLDTAASCRRWSHLKFSCQASILHVGLSPKVAAVKVTCCV